MYLNDELRRAAHDFLEAAIHFTAARRHAFLALARTLPQLPVRNDELALFVRRWEAAHIETVVNTAAESEAMKKWLMLSKQDRQAIFSVLVLQKAGRASK